MHILIVSNLYPPNVVGGYERLCFDVAAALVRNGHRITVLTSDFGSKTAEFPGQQVHRRLRLLVGDGIYAPYAGSPAERDTLNHGNLAALRETVDQAKPDAVFAWNLFFLDRSFLGALGANGTPVITMLTDNWLIAMERPDYLTTLFRDHVFGTHPFPLHPPAPAGGGGWLHRAIGRLAGRSVAPSPAKPAPHRFPFAAVFGSRFVQAMYGDSGFEFQSSQVVHNGVQQARPPAAAFQDRSRLVAPDELRLLFAGRLVDLKGAHTAVEMLPLLTPGACGVGRIRLTILGDTQDAAYMAHLHETIARTGCTAQIDLRPPVAEDALFALFQDHDIYLFPSLYEPFSLTLIHALACGIPTVASDAGGNAEIVRDRTSGLLFDKGDPASLARSVQTLATDPALRTRVAAGGREAAGRFTFDRMVTEMEAFLQARSAG